MVVADPGILGAPVLADAIERLAAPLDAAAGSRAARVGADLVALVERRGQIGAAQTDREPPRTMAETKFCSSCSKTKPADALYMVEEVLPDHYVQSMIGHTVDRQVAEQLVEHVR